MTDYQSDPLVSRDVSMRHAEQDKLKTHQQKEMDNRRVSAPQSAWNQSVAATTDDYMKNALTQVRKSDVTLPDSLTRHNGTWVHNQK